MQHRFRILGISGSLRRSSANTAVLRTIQEALTTADMDIFDLSEIPAYNEDTDGDAAPAAVRALRERLAAADAVILASPEYNHGMSGVLKNALDWASRPHGASALKNKPVLNITASPAFTGGVRAHQQMNETLVSMGARTINRPQIVIGTVHQKLSENRLTDAASLGFALAGVEDLLREAAILRLHANAA
jgi:chromate reductase, NAD(P)H dehydrogenase (quinone)